MKRTTSIIALILMLFISMLSSSIPTSKANSEAPPTEWSQTYGPFEGHTIVQTIDGGYAIAGANATYGNRGSYRDYMPLLIKTDASDKLQWGKTFGSEFGAGGAAKSGANQRFWLSAVWRGAFEN